MAGSAAGGWVGPPSLAHPPERGWHFPEWSAEFLGTFVLVLGGLSAICLDFGQGSPMPHLVPSASLRLLITGLLFAGTGSLVAISPPGRLSGAHVNPCVTLAFFVGGHVSWGDLVGYLGGQFAGAAAGALALHLLWGPIALSVKDGLTAPQSGVTPLAAVGIEALMTGVLVLAIFSCTSFTRSARFTPLVLWIVIALLVWRGAPYTDCSLNPARSLGPALVFGSYQLLWVYLVGPPLGAVAAAGLFLTVSGRRHPLTAKLFHDARFRSVLATRLPSRRR
ncbi:MAG: MIP/aquaporin family protein [Candidatus Dormibacteria bacterium]